MRTRQGQQTLDGIGVHLTCFGSNASVCDRYVQGSCSVIQCRVAAPAGGPYGQRHVLLCWSGISHQLVLIGSWHKGRCLTVSGKKCAL